MAATLSVLLTYYNEGALLTQCLRSLFEGAVPPDECLIYDDASTVPPGPFIPAGLPVRVIRGEKNVGPGVGRNILAKASTAEFIHFHDSDDCFSPDWGRQIKLAMGKDRVDAIFTEISDRAGGTPVQELKSFVSGDEIVRFCLSDRCILTSAGTFRKTLVERIGGYRVALWQSEDLDFHIRIGATNPKIAVILEPLVFRMRVAGRSDNKREVNTDSLRAIKFLSKELDLQFRPLLADSAALYASRLFRDGEKQKAREGFRLSKELGSSLFSNRNLVFRVFARFLGPETAERIADVYRRKVPEKLREKVSARR